MRRLAAGLSAFGLIVLGWSATAPAQNDPGYECDNQFGECGTPNQSGGGGGGGSILVNRTDRGDTYQFADDYDDDGIEDTSDNCPRIANRSQSDADSDGVGNACDNCLNTPNEPQGDLDGDGVGDACDSDKDGDDVLNKNDNCPVDPNPKVDGVQPNQDGDKFGDACDDDIDGDGKLNLEDPCPADADISNPNNTEPGSKCFPDQDGDGVTDFKDNCAGIYNPNQANLDGDKDGDPCDPDMDGDGVIDPRDNCKETPNPPEGPLQPDGDRDGKGDACDSNFCYVVLGDKSNCLDPNKALEVYSPKIVVNTEDSKVPLRLFANRRSEALRYHWRLKAAPKESRAVVKNRKGTVTVSTPFEYRYQAGSVPHFNPDRPGTYRFHVTVEPIFKDRVESKKNVKATYTVPIEVEGEPVGRPGESGCGASVASNESPPLSGLFWMAALGIFGFAARRRRS